MNEHAPSPRSRPADGDAAPAARADPPARPVRRVTAVPALRFLDVGDAAGAACDLDDPDCVAPAAVTGDEGDA